MLIASPLGRAVLAFACLGAFWGAWDACLPDLARATAVPDGRLGAILVCAILGALPAMWLAGRLGDRAGARFLAPAVAVFAASALLPPLARGPASLAAALVVTGAASGGLDVLMNTAASDAEIDGGRHRMSLVHAAYSAALCAGALAGGIVLQGGASFRAVLAGTAALILTAAFAARGDGRSAEVPSGTAITTHAPTPLAVLLLGLLCALGFTMENGIEMWSAVLLRREMGAPPAISALGPALFGAAAVAGRLAGHPLVRALGEARLLLLAGLFAAVGTAWLSVAPTWPVALPALLLCGGGVSVVAPTCVSLAGRAVSATQRGAAVSTVARIAYAGLLLAPLLMGALSGAAGLRTAMLAFAGFAVAFGVGGAALVLFLRARPGVVGLV